jgi:hypothetical protein
VNKLHFVFVFAFVMSLQACTPDTGSEVESGLAGEIDIAITSHNVPVVDGSYMIALGRAFEEIKAGDAEYVMTDGNREYQFDGFSVIVRDEQ